MRSNSGYGSLHPLVATAAVSVIVFSAVGIASMTGGLAKLQSAFSSPAPVVQSAPVAASVATPPVGAPVTAPVAPAVAEVPAPAPEKAKAETRPTPTHKKPIAHAPQRHERAEEQVADASEAAPVSRKAPVCEDCGVVDSIEAYQVQGKASGMGAVGGAVAGGVLGHQVGKGRGKDVATVLGVLGGAFAGNQIEQNTKKETRYHVSIRMENGSYRRVDLQDLSGLHEGQKVRLDGEAIIPE